MLAWPGRQVRQGDKWVKFKFPTADSADKQHPYLSISSIEAIMEAFYHDRASMQIHRSWTSRRDGFGIFSIVCYNMNGLGG